MWFFRKLHHLDELLLVGRWSTETNPIEIRALPPCYNFADASPPHPVIFAGELNDLSRYKEMGKYSWSQAFPSSIWGPDPAVSEVAYNADSTAAKSVAPAPLPVFSSLSSPTSSSWSSSSSHISSVTRSGLSQTSRPAPCMSFFS